jgi:hypothetical protein
VFCPWQTRSVLRVLVCREWHSVKCPVNWTRQSVEHKVKSRNSVMSTSHIRIENYIYASDDNESYIYMDTLEGFI